MPCGVADVREHGSLSKRGSLATLTPKPISYVSRTARHRPPPRDSLQRQPILGAQLFELGQDAIRHGRNAFRHQAIHHSLDELDLVLYGKVDKVGVDQDAVGRAEGGVVGEEEGGRERGAGSAAGGGSA